MAKKIWVRSVPRGGLRTFFYIKTQRLRALCGASPLKKAKANGGFVGCKLCGGMEEMQSTAWREITYRTAPPSRKQHHRLPFCKWLVACLAVLLLPHAIHAQLVPPHAPHTTFSGIEEPALWVVPATLIAGGALLVNEFNLSGANMFRKETYGGAGRYRPHLDDYLQHTPMAIGILFDLAGAEGRRESIAEKLTVKAMGGVAVAAIVLGVKSLGLAQRPDARTRNSFMSGHTATVFLGAELLRLEYGTTFPYVAAAGYGIAVATAMFRVWHMRHWTSDVVAGAGVGIAAAWIGHYTGTLLVELISESIQAKRPTKLWQY